MTKDYERQCWNCDSRDMEDKGAYIQCRACGATWNEVPKPGWQELEPGNVELLLSSGPIKFRAKHPSASVKRRAAAARAQASQ